jgi:hypothetical protein
MMVLIALSVAMAEEPGLEARGYREAAPPAEAVTESHGQDHGRGNLVGIQPWMTAADYASADTFRARLATWFDVAKERGWLLPDTVVVLPEYVGTWLVAVGEEPDVHAAPTVDAAMKLVVKRHFVPVMSRMITSRAKSRAVDAIFRTKADEMAAAYDAAFSDLARTYQVTVVAGSILLPNPSVADGHVIAGKGRIQNVTAVYGSDGNAFPELARKVQPTDDELPFVKGQPADVLPTFDTKLGTVGVLVCADSWYPHTYETLAGRDADVIVVPSFLSKSGGWAEPWHGYNGAEAPEDVDLADVENLTEGEAWQKYALASRGPDAAAEAGINVFLRGRIWDLGADGQTIAVLGREVTLGQPVDAPAVFNLWLGEEPLTPEAQDSADADGAPAHPR